MFAEPCAGDGSLIRLLDGVATCGWATDINPQGPKIGLWDALGIRKHHLEDVDCIITNPPYSWPMLKPLLDHLPTLKNTWLLLPADYMNNKRMGPYMRRCATIVSIGRLYWDAEKPVKGVDNYCWYEFTNAFTETVFIGRN